jgi:2-(1,2-epoxy-1,2-dihydrophenyl)acetyl-CoA isomerase
MSEVILERRGRVAIVTLNRPESLNAFNRAMRAALAATLRDVGNDPAIRAVVLTGAGRGFSAGAELKDEAMPDGAGTERMVNEEYGASLRAIAAMEKPVIAAVNGFATGIGGSFALVCDLVVMGEKAFFQVPFQKIGLVPDGGMTWFLGERLGHRRAFELAVSGDRVPSSKCLEWGLANRVVADERLLDEAVAWAEELCDAAPMALRFMKQLLRTAPDLGLLETIKAEATMQGQCIESADFTEGVTAFREKRSPRFTGK